MKTNFSKFLIALIVTAGIVSCGSDNESGANVVSGASPITNVPTFTTGTCESASSYDDFYNRVNNFQFIKESTEYQTYYFSEQELDEDDCRFLGINCGTTYKWKTIRQFQRSSIRDQDSVSHEAGSTKESVRNYLMGILNQKVQSRGAGSYYEVLHANGDIFGVDLCKPIGANPVFRWSEQTKERYFYQGSSSGSFGSSSYGQFTY
jgi:hypothetical protein